MRNRLGTPLWFWASALHHLQLFPAHAVARISAGDKFLKILSEVRDRYDFGLFGYVVMPEHIHLLVSEPNIGNPSDVMAALKQRVSRVLRKGENRAPVKYSYGTNQRSGATRDFGSDVFTTSTCGA